jgi:hypothetical protein
MDSTAQVVFTGLGLLPLLERFRLLLFRRAVTLELSFFQAAYADRIPTWTFMTAWKAPNRREQSSHRWRLRQGDEGPAAPKAASHRSSNIHFGISGQRERGSITSV